MKKQIVAASFLLALLTAPLAAEASEGCGVPQGYGTTNPFTFNRSTCGPGDVSYSHNAVVLNSERAKPQGYGTTNPYIPNSGAAHLGSNTATE